MKQVSEYVYRWDRGSHISDFAPLVDAGIERVFDLETGWADFWHVYGYETNRRGIQLVQLCWSNFFPPRFYQAIEVIRGLAQPIPTCVFCYSNVDRTGAAILFHRVANEGWAFEAAYAEFVAEGRHWWFGWWKPFLRGVACRLAQG